MPDTEKATRGIQPELFALTSKRQKKLMNVDVAKIDVPGDAAFSQTELADLADNIRRMTLLEPPILLRADGRYTPIIGRRRCAALKILAAQDPRWATVEMYVRTDDVSDADVAKMVLSENAARSANVLAELDSINVLLKDKRMTPEGVARSVGQNVAWVKKRLKLNDLAAPLLKHMEKGRVRFETAVSIAKLDTRQQTRVLKAFEDKRKDDKNATLSGADVSAASSRGTVKLPEKMFEALPPTEGTADPKTARRRATDAPHPALEYAVEDSWPKGKVAIVVWTATPPSEAKRKAMTKAIQSVIKYFAAEDE